MAVPEDDDRRRVPPEARLELGRHPTADEPLVHEENAHSPEIDTAHARQARQRWAVGVALDGGDRRQAAELREHRRAPNVAAVEDVVDRREDARHVGMEHAVRVRDEADLHSLRVLLCAMQRWFRRPRRRSHGTRSVG